MRKEFKIQNNYLWLPVKKNALAQNVIIEKSSGLLPIIISPADDEVDFYAYINVESDKGRSIFIDCSGEAGWLDNIKQADTPPEKVEAMRPLLHFTADVGWINDPNGLILHNGLYHMFFQYNPFGTEWNNMSWGHAVSEDLISWKQLDVALCPDEEGTMFSGSGIADKNNLLGYGENAMIFYYTCAGGTNELSKDKAFVQKLAYSCDNGFTLTKVPYEVVGHIAKETRDPKVFWHEDTGAYIMVLYIDGWEFAVFRSTDLKNWSQTQRLTLEGCIECPDLFPLKNKAGGTDWVFWTATGCYFIGEFDGYSFTPKSEPLKAYVGELPYAAQTFSGTDKIISVAWLRTKNLGTSYTGMMSIPREVTLVEEGAEKRLGFALPEGFSKRKKTRGKLENLKEGKYEIAYGDQVPYELIIKLKNTGRGKAVVRFLGQGLVINLDEGIAVFGDQRFSFGLDKELCYSVIVDIGVVEISDGQGTALLISQMELVSLQGDIEITVEEGTELIEISQYIFR